MSRHLHIILLSLSLALCLPAQAQMVGTLNTQFGGQGGTISLPSSEEQSPTILRTLPDGGFYSAQSQLHLTSGLAEVRRFTAEGYPDPTFGEAGVREIALEGVVHDIQVDADSNLYLCGYVQRGRNKDVWVLKLQKDGRTSPDFGIQGVVTLTIQEQDVAQQLQILDRGSLLVAGTTYSPTLLERDIFLIKLDEKGRMDFRFGERGSSIIDISKDDRLKEMQLREDGRIILAGNARPDRLSRYCVTRLLANGKADPAFGQEGTVIIPVGNDQSYLQAMSLLEDGSIIVGGNARMNPADPGFDLAIVRLLPEGQWDPSFGHNGVFVHDMGGADYFGDLTVLSDQQLIVSGITGKDIKVIRLRRDGRIDPTYGQNGECHIEGSGRIKAVWTTLDAAENLLLSASCSSESRIVSLHGNPQLPHLDELLDFDWSTEQEQGLSYSGLQLSDDIQIDAWLGGALLASSEQPTTRGIESTQPIEKHIRFFAHLALDEDHQYTFVWDSEGQAHWYWNGSFQNSWDVLKEKK